MEEHLGSAVDRSERGKKEVSGAGRVRLAPGRVPGSLEPLLLMDVGPQPSSDSSQE